MTAPTSLDFDPTVIDWLPPPTPIIENDAIWHTIVEDKFYYTLASDHSTFDEWQTAIFTTLYDVRGTQSWEPNEIDQINAYKFSAFVLGFQCYTPSVNDGCCMVSQDNGAICIFRNEDDEIDTYRFYAEDVDYDIIPNSQSGLAKDLKYFDPVDKFSEPQTALEYMDFFGCSGNEEANVCLAWQPNWKFSWNGYGQDDAYPRFGTKETGILAGIVDASSSSPINFKEISLQGGLTLVAAGIATTILTLF